MTVHLTSLNNPVIKQVRKLRDRRERQAAGQYFVEGIRLVAEAVSVEAPVEILLVAPELLNSEVALHTIQEYRARGGTVLEVSADVFRSISLKDGPQGIAAVVRQKWFELSEIPGVQEGDWLALDSVQDPGNLGTILRTHDAVGGVGLILLDQSTDPYDPTAVRASMGSIFTQKLIKTSLEEFACWKKQHRAVLVGTSGAADQDYHSVHYPDRLVLLMGSERLGLQQKHLDLCDQLVSIPMVGRSDSLNLAVATGVVLYEIFNKRRQNHGLS
jgi:TrmH family RNA methyltransferase